MVAFAEAGELIACSVEITNMGRSHRKKAGVRRNEPFVNPKRARRPRDNHAESASELTRRVLSLKNPGKKIQGVDLPAIFGTACDSNTMAMQTAIGIKMTDVNDRFRCTEAFCSSGASAILFT